MVHLSGKPVRSRNIIDFWRGFSLVEIFINHSDIVFSYFTHRQFSISDAADIFVFLSGWALFLATGGDRPIPDLKSVRKKLIKRFFALYVIQISLVLILVCVVYVYSMVGDAKIPVNSSMLYLFGENILDNMKGLIILSYQPFLLDIIPMYAVFIILSIISLPFLQNVSFVFSASIAVYIICFSFSLNFDRIPGDGSWSFNPLTWQLTFFLGFVLASSKGIGGLVRRQLPVLRIVFLPFVLISMAIDIFPGFVDILFSGDTAFGRFVSKQDNGPIRVVSFLILIVYAAPVYSYVSKRLHAVDCFLSLLGRNSLLVFSLLTLLSVSAQITRGESGHPLLLDAFILVGGLAVLWSAATVAERRKQIVSHGVV
jgi:hypothetical protein